MGKELRLSEYFEGGLISGHAVIRHVTDGEEYSVALGPGEMTGEFIKDEKKSPVEEKQRIMAVRYHLETERILTADYEAERQGITLTAGDVAKRQAVTIELRCRQEENSLFLEWGEVRESPEWHLIEVTFPFLVKSSAGKKPAFFHCEHRGGYLSDLEHLDEDSRIRGEGRFKGYPNASVLPVAGILQEDFLCVMEVQGYVCHTLLEADEEKVALGVTAPYRIRGKYGAHENVKTPDIPVNQTEIVRIETAPMPEDGKAGWLKAAKMVRSHFPLLKSTFFDDKFVFIIQNQLGRKQTELDYEQTEKLLIRISNLTGGNPMVAFLTGWSQGGHDTSYPNIYTMNPRLGDEAAFQELKQRMKEKFHCTLSLNDNFDDMYRNEFTEGRWFREKYVARTIDNQLETFETWNGVDKSYITGMHHYMKPGEDGERRIRYHGEHYRLENAILIDALSWWSIRNNWNPEEPASAVDNLRAKFEIIRRFHEDYGIHVLSELVRYPFLGKLQVAFDNSMAYDKPSCHDIPFLREVLRGVMYYGGRGGDDLDVPDMLYHNASKHAWFRRGEKAERITEIFYLNYVPWFLLHHLELEGYQEKEGVYDLLLEKNTRIHIDNPQGSWYVIYDGTQILENNHLTCPFGDHRIAFYGKEDGVLCYDGLAGRKIVKAEVCEENGAVPGEAWVKDGRLYGKVIGGRGLIVTLKKMEKGNRL